MPKQPDPWRSQIRTLQLRRRSLESQLLQPRPMIAASLLERFLPGGQSRRSSPAYYLSRWQQGRSKLTYVRKQDWLPCASNARLTASFNKSSQLGAK